MYVTDEQFQQYIDDAFASLPKKHTDSIQNVAIVYADDPSPEQRVQLELRNDQSLLGLFEGVSLPARNGMNNFYGPAKITLFKGPLLSQSRDLADFKDQIRHTLWHEIAHYFGLNHDQIRELE